MTHLYVSESYNTLKLRDVCSMTAVAVSVIYSSVISQTVILVYQHMRLPSASETGTEKEEEMLLQRNQTVSVHNLQTVAHSGCGDIPVGTYSQFFFS